MRLSVSRRWRGGLFRTVLATTVAAQVQAFDLMHGAECRELRAGVEPLLDGAGSAAAVPL